LVSHWQSRIAALGARWVILDIHFSGTIVVIVIRVPLGGMAGSLSFLSA